ncbi:T4SS effector SidA family protein [Legionella resiliens]|uniref:T4SS effector SidA family protein n=1 Tax=Legionella resiliens TaxID=2905958 RepID=A0ABS8X5R7_9GAMM|nr:MULTISPECIES: T4SS effector SidA family protein [unclassified Legionella]MCE0724043.1 T4SS effector SidA family protein [Legionella sp. 9fVS26]MCE3533196.1 T4SS effector SidA family protein [Legionella sp. 8cVS16]
MTYSRKNHVVLSDEMDDLKKRINQRKKEQKSYIEIAHKKGKLSQRLLEGAQKFFGLAATAFSSAKELPYIGFVFQIVAIIPASIAMITDKNSSILGKILAVSFLLGLTALGITAFVMGGLVAAKIGLALASLVTVIEGMSFIGSLFNKYKTWSAYKEKEEFNHLLDSLDSDALENNKYRERLEIRALELEHLLEHSTSSSLEKENEELQFINTIRNKKPYVPPQMDNTLLRFINAMRSKIGWEKLPSDDPPITKLSNLYDERKIAVSYLAKITEIIDKDDQTSHSILIDQVTELQHQIAQIDKEIESITEPLHELQRNDLLANEAIPKSFTNFALGGAGVILSTIGLMILLSAVAAPPIMGPILFGFGIGLAIFGVVKWGIELYATSQDEKFKRKLEKENEGIILEEALYEYDHGCSYSNAMRPILDSKDTTSEKPTNTTENDLAEISEPPSIESTKLLESTNAPPKSSGEYQI